LKQSVAAVASTGAFAGRDTFEFQTLPPTGNYASSAIAAVPDFPSVPDDTFSPSARPLPAVGAIDQSARTYVDNRTIRNH
jgi:hypothetical protein